MTTTDPVTASDQLETDSGFAEGWKPNRGDKLAGDVIDITATDMGYGPYPIVTVRTEDGSEIAVHAFHTLLQNELARRRPKVGDRLEVTYLGKKSGASSGRDYHSYRVTGGQDVAFNWGDYLPEGEKQQSGTAEPPIPASTPPVATPAVEPTEPQRPQPAATVADDDVPF